MNEKELQQNVDFLSIALEEMDAENYQSAQEFIEEVYGNMIDETESFNSR